MQSSQHMVLIWFLAAVLVIAMAGPFPQATTMLLVIILFLVLVKNLSTLQNYVPGSNNSIV